MRHDMRVRGPHRSDEPDECIEDVYAGRGEAAARRVVLRRAPALIVAAGALVAEMAFDVKDLAELAAGGDTSERLHRAPQAFVVTESERHTRAPAGFDRLF